MTDSVGFNVSVIRSVRDPVRVPVSVACGDRLSDTFAERLNVEENVNVSDCVTITDRLEDIVKLIVTVPVVVGLEDHEMFSVLESVRVSSSVKEPDTLADSDVEYV